MLTQAQTLNFIIMNSVVTATDAAGNASTQDVTVTVANIDDTAPTIIKNFSI